MSRPGQGIGPAGTERSRIAIRVAPYLYGAIVFVALWAVFVRPIPANGMTDFDQVWLASRALLHGADPYAAVQHSGWPYPLYYPLTAAVLVMPVSWLSIEAARFVFLAVGTAACVAVVTSRGAWGLHALVSGAMLQVFQFVQWPPLEMGALALSPVLAGAVWSAKPTIGLAFFAAYAFPDARRMQRALLGGVAMLAISLAFRPNWPLEWLAAIRYAPHVIAPVTLLPLGPIALAALARWRRPEARLIAALACVPQTFVPLATLPLFLVPRSRAEMLSLLGASWLLLAYWYRFPPIEGTPLGLAARVRETGQVIIALSYLPCLAMVLRRPNEGIVPQWMERISDRLPPWLGGCAPVTR